MIRPKICASLVSDDPGVARVVEPLVELLEVRIDLVGDGWRRLAGQLKKPWIACNRSRDEGGSWRGSESERIDELLSAIELGADIVDIEIETKNLHEAVKLVKKRAKCLLSYHDLKGTPTLGRMREIVQKQLEAGADICKLVTTARKFEDNITVLQLISDFPEIKIVSFAMGPLGSASRILCPLMGGDFTYASVEQGKEAASGQITAADLRKIYVML